MTPKDIEQIIKRVTQQVLSQEMRESPQGILAVFCENVYDPAGITAFFAGKNVTCALPDGAQVPLKGCQMLQFEKDRYAILQTLATYEQIVLVTPSLKLMDVLARADDTDFAAAVCIRPLLWGKQVSILLDFESPKHMRGTAFAAIVENLDALEKMGVCISTLPRKGKIAQAKELVTEQDVRDACKEGHMRIRILPDAIVTQLAQDTAKECGVSIEF